MIVRMQHWTIWRGREVGCAVLGLVCLVQAYSFVRISWPDAGVYRLQNYGGEECRLRSYHLPVWNVSQPIVVFRIRGNLTDTCPQIGISAIDVGKILPGGWGDIPVLDNHSNFWLFFNPSLTFKRSSTPSDRPDRREMAKSRGSG